MNEYQELALAFIGITTLYFTVSRASMKTRSKNDKEIIKFLDTLESDLETEIKRTEVYSSGPVNDKHEDLKTA